MTQRIAYTQQLQELNEKIVEMGHMAETMISDTIAALIEKDTQKAKKVMGSDDEVDKMQLDIEKYCAKLIAHQQPIASDLRLILSVVKIVTDIERIADQCCDICKYSLKLEEETWSKDIAYQRHIKNMAESTEDMLTRALNTFVTKNTEEIKKICQADDQIDDHFVKIWNEIKEEMIADKDFIKSGLRYIMIIKYIERIADHVTNIAEWIYYSLTGEYVIHAPASDIETR